MISVLWKFFSGAMALVLLVVATVHAMNKDYAHASFVLLMAIILDPSLIKTRCE